jgi:hypothetical protein
MHKVLRKVVLGLAVLALLIGVASLASMGTEWWPGSLSAVTPSIGYKMFAAAVMFTLAASQFTLQFMSAKQN